MHYYLWYIMSMYDIVYEIYLYGARILHYFMK